MCVGAPVPDVAPCDALITSISPCNSSKASWVFVDSKLPSGVTGDLKAGVYVADTQVFELESHPYTLPSVTSTYTLGSLSVGATEGNPLPVTTAPLPATLTGDHSLLTYEYV